MFYGDFGDKGDVCQSFQIDNFEGHVIFAAYDSDGYDGSAAVLYVHDGLIYYVTGSHCSCYGLEDQWQPEVTDVGALRRMAKDGYVLRNYQRELARIFDALDEAKLIGDDPEAQRAVLRAAFG